MTAATRRKPRVLRRVLADENNAVLSVAGDQGAHRVKPCGGCPWRVDQAGAFPAQAFRISAPTAYDAAFEMFGCHESGANAPATCAGFLLRNADHNIGARIATSQGRIRWEAIHDGGHVLHDSYRAMAIANGVDPEDPALKKCRP
jgi:hypothetical protein